MKELCEYMIFVLDYIFLGFYCFLFIDDFNKGIES